MVFENGVKIYKPRLIMARVQYKVLWYSCRYANLFKTSNVTDLDVCEARLTQTLNALTYSNKSTTLFRLLLKVNWRKTMQQIPNENRRVIFVRQNIGYYWKCYLSSLYFDYLCIDILKTNALIRNFDCEEKKHKNWQYLAFPSASKQICSRYPILFAWY